MPGHHVTATASPDTCVATQTARDHPTFQQPMTEIRNKQTWSFDGSQVTAASAIVSAHPLGLPGWSVLDVNSSYGGQTVPALGIQNFGDAEFQFTGGAYHHFHYADSISEGNGDCDGSFSFSGSLPSNGYITSEHHLE